MSFDERKRRTVNDQQAMQIAITAADRARKTCTRRRAVSPVIHILVPSAAAVRPSSVVAIFKTTNGRFVFR